MDGNVDARALRGEDVRLARCAALLRPLPRDSEDRLRGDRDRSCARRHADRAGQSSKADTATAAASRAEGIAPFWIAAGRYVVARASPEATVIADAQRPHPAVCVAARALRSAMDGVFWIRYAV